jgi:hypothetical protein
MSIYFNYYERRAEFYTGWLNARYPHKTPTGYPFFCDGGSYMAALELCVDYTPKSPVAYIDVLGMSGTLTWADIKPILLDNMAEINPRDFGKFAVSDRSKEAVRAWKEYADGKQ